MNRVYKVIWSKAKHCYVVTSEIARSVTKSASSARSAGRKGAAVLAMAALLFTAGGVLGEVAANVTDVKQGSTADVIMVTKDGNTDKITINDVYHALKADSDGDGLIIKENYAKVNTDGKVAKAVAADSAEQATKDGDGKEISSTYVKNDDANLDTDGNYVKTDKKVGENLSALDTQVKANADAVAAEENARKAADQNNLKVGDDGVISKVTGNDGTTSSAVNTLVLNKDGKNQITLSEDGIKVGKNSTVIASDGVFAGGDTATDAKAALNANGSIKGANGAFTVDENGNVASKATITGETVTDGKGASMSNGTVTGGTVTSTGNISALGDIHASGNITGANASIQGALTAGSATITGGLTAGGDIQGKSISDGTATMKNGDITGVKNLSAETITTHGDLTVNGKLNMDEIDMTKDGIVGDNNVKSSSTKVAAGEIRSYKDAISLKDGSEKESAINYDENGTSTWAKATDADGKWNKSSLTVEGKGIKSIATDGTNNASTNLSNKGFNTYASDGGKNKTYTKQTAESLTSQIGDDGKVMSVMNAEGISNNADGGTITNSAKDLVNTASENMTNTVDNDLTTTVGGEMKTTVTGNVTEDYKANLSTTVGGGQTTTVTGDSSLSATNIENKASSSIWNYVGEGYNTSWKMTDGKISESIVNGTASNKENTTVDGTKRIITNGEGTGTYNQTATSNNISLKNAAEDTSFTKSESLDGEKTSVTNPNGSSTINQSAESIVNFVKNSEGTTKTEQSAKDITNTAKNGTITNDANDVLNKGANSVINKVGDNKVAVKTDRVKVAYGSDTYTTWNDKGITSNTSGNMSNSATNIANSATEKLSNSAADIENKASNSIWNHVGEGYNTSWKMTDGKISESIVNGTASNKENTTVDGTKRIITNGEGTGTYNQTATSNNISLKNAAEDTSFTKSESLDGEKTSVTNPNGSSTINQSAESIVNFVKNSEGTTKTEQSAVDIKNTAKNGTITNDAKTVMTITGNNTVTSDNGGTTFANKDAKTPFEEGDERGTRDNTKITGNKVETGKVLTDFAEVANNLDVKGSTTLGRDENTTLTVNSKSTFKDTVKMDKTLEVDGESTFNNKVTITKGGLNVVQGGTTTDTLTVTGTSVFGGEADFKDNVSMGKGLAVAGETRTGTLHVENGGYVGGDLKVDGNIETHDAVLSADSRQVVTGRQLYQTNERVDRLDNRIKKVGANAAALAALRPGDFNPDDKFSIAAGFGSYRNANAAALGLFYRPNENVLLSLGTSFGDGENMVNAGVSVKFGRGKSMAERRKEMADEVSSMRDEMRSQDERIAELEEMLKKQNELIEKLSKES